MQINEIEELINCIRGQFTERVFFGIENKFDEELRILIQKEVE